MTKWIFVGRVAHVHIGIKEQRCRNPARLRVCCVWNATVNIVMKVAGDVHVEVCEKQVVGALAAAAAGGRLGDVDKDSATIDKSVFPGGTGVKMTAMSMMGGKSSVCDVIPIEAIQNLTGLKKQTGGGCNGTGRQVPEAERYNVLNKRAVEGAASCPATNQENVGTAEGKGIGFRSFMQKKEELQKPDPLQAREWGMK
jgi:hypothetical protein